MAEATCENVTSRFLPNEDKDMRSAKLTNAANVAYSIAADPCIQRESDETTSACFVGFGICSIQLSRQANWPLFCPTLRICWLPNINGR